MSLTVHDLAADWSVWDHAVGFTLGKRGRTVWESAVYPEGGEMRTVRVSRFLPFTITAVYRYVDPATPVSLVIEAAQ